MGNILNPTGILHKPQVLTNNCRLTPSVFFHTIILEQQFLLTPFVSNITEFSERAMKKNQLFIAAHLSVIFFFIFCFSSLAASQVHTRDQVAKVLILLSYHETHSWTANVLNGIKDELASSNINVELHVEFMDTKRHTPNRISPQLEVLYQSKYNNIQFDLIILSDNNALNFLLPRRQSLFPSVPVVFCGINNFTPSLVEDHDLITGVAEDSDLAGTIQLALQLQPNTRHIAIVSDNTPTGIAHIEKIQKIYPDFNNQIEFIELFNQTEKALKKSLHNLPKHTIILMLSFYNDRNGKQFTVHEQAKLITETSQVAVYTAWDIFLGLGVVGGVMTNGASQGKNAAQLAIKILHGEPPENIAVISKSPNIPTLDFNVVKHFNLPLTQLSPETVFINEPQSFYEKNTRIIWITLFIFLFQFLAISFLIINIRRRKQAEQCLKEQSNRLKDIVGERTAKLLSTNRELAQEIKDRKKTEAAIRKSDEQWNKTFDAFPDIVTLRDNNLRIIKANKAAVTMLGHSYSGIVGQSCHELFTGSTKTCPGCPLQESKKNLIPYTREIYHEKLQKTFLVSAAPIINTQEEDQYFVHLAKDITDIKEAEMERARLAAAIKQAAEAIFITDIKGNIQYVNPAFEKLTGYSRNEIIGKNPRILRSDKHDQNFYKKIWTTLLRGEIWHGRIINRKKDGSLFEEEATLSPVKNNTGKITNFVAVKRDVSKEVALEQQLRQSLKMEAVGTLAGGIAHDFNNILSVIIGCGEFIRDEVSKESQIGQNIETILTSGKRAADLVRQILTFSRHDISKNDVFSPYPLACEALKMLRATLPATITIEEHFDPDCGMIMADPAIIHQIFINLCTNSLQALPEQKGHLRVQLLRRTASKSPEIPPADFVVITVRDNGCGMEPETIDRIFEPYFTTKAVGKGTGLGLAIVHGAVKEYEGFIEVKSTPGEGSTISVFLPLIKQTPLQKHTSKQKQKDKNKTEISNTNILMVDDELLLVKINTKRLEAQGYQVTAFTDSRKALEIFRAQPNQFDLLITDQTMPNLTGAELAKALLKIKPSLPIIMCTGHSATVSKEHSIALGIKKYVFKPLHGDELLEAVHEVLTEK